MVIKGRTDFNVSDNLFHSMYPVVEKVELTVAVQVCK